MIPEQLRDSSETTKLLYLYLEEHRSATANELKNTLSIPLLSLYSYLQILEEMEYIKRDNGKIILNK